MFCMSSTEFMSGVLCNNLRVSTHCFVFFGTSKVVIITKIHHCKLNFAPISLFYSKSCQGLGQ